MRTRSTTPDTPDTHAALWRVAALLERAGTPPFRLLPAIYDPPQRGADLERAAEAAARALAAGARPADVAALGGGVPLAEGVLVRPEAWAYEGGTTWAVSLDPGGLASVAQLEGLLAEVARREARAQAYGVRLGVAAAEAGRSLQVEVELEAWIATRRGARRLSASGVHVAHPPVPGACGRSDDDHRWIMLARTVGISSRRVHTCACRRCGTVGQVDWDPHRLPGDGPEEIRTYTRFVDLDPAMREAVLDRALRDGPRQLRGELRHAILQILKAR